MLYKGEREAVPHAASRAKRGATMEEERDLIRTKDSDEAAFYLTMDSCFSLAGAETKESRGRKVVWFLFNTTLSRSEIDTLRQDYLQGKCLVDPFKYARRRAEIRSIIFKKCYGE